MTGPDYEKIATAMDRFLEQHPDAKNLVLGESHNDASEHYKMLSNPEIVSVLHKHGMTTTALESPAIFQDHANKVMFEGQGPESFANEIAKEYANIGAPEEELAAIRASYEAQGRLIQEQARLGSAVIFFDNPDKSLAERDQEIKSTGELYGKALDLAGEYYMTSIAPKLPAEFLLNTADEMQASRERGWADGVGKTQFEPAKRAEEESLKIRLNPEDEQLRAQHIKENAIGGTVVLAGHEHGARYGDLDAGLNAARLSVVPDMRTYAERSQNDYNLGREFPEGYLVLDEARIISGEEAYQAAGEFDAKMRQMLGQEGPQPLPVNEEPRPQPSGGNSLNM